MKTRIIVLIFSMMLIIQAISAAEIPKDQNAAIRYLMAIGYLPACTDEIEKEIRVPECFQGKFSAVTIDFLESVEKRRVIYFLKLGANCSTCNFVPDNTNSFNDPVPPLRALRVLARTAVTIGVIKDNANNASEALGIYKAVFMLGQHIEERGNLLSGIVGLAIRKMAMKAFDFFLDRHSEKSWKDSIKTFLQKIPNPAMNARQLMKFEKLTSEQLLLLAKKNPRLLKEFDPFSETAPRSKEIPSRGKMCEANQRVLRGATEMMLMDYTVIPASASERLIDFFVENEYLINVPICSSNGQYKIEVKSSNEIKVECSYHSSCWRNMCVLMGAMEMMLMDYTVIPASASGRLIDFLVEDKYLKSATICPEEGKYTIEFKLPDECIIKCSVHPFINGTKGSSPPKDIVKNLSNVASQAIIDFLDQELDGKIKLTPENFDRMASETMAIWDEIMNLDAFSPEFEKRASELGKKLENSKNPIIDILIPNARKVFLLQKELQDQINKLINL